MFLIKVLKHVFFNVVIDKLVFCAVDEAGDGSVSVSDGSTAGAG